MNSRPLELLRWLICKTCKQWTESHLYTSDLKKIDEKVSYKCRDQQKSKNMQYLLFAYPVSGWLVLNYTVIPIIIIDCSDKMHIFVIRILNWGIWIDVQLSFFSPSLYSFEYWLTNVYKMIYLLHEEIFKRKMQEVYRSSMI